MEGMKKLIAINVVIGFTLILASLYSSFGSVYAQATPGNATQACSASNVISDSCYVQYCTGVASEDSTSCNAYASYVVKRDSAGSTSCQSIGKNNEKSCCLNSSGDLTANASPMCQAYEDNSSADISTDANQKFTPNAPVTNGLNIHLNNPLSGVSTIPDAINKFLGIIIRIALPLIIVFFIWSGFSFILARGNAKKVTDAKNMFLFTIIGTLLILGAWVITNAIIGTVNSITG